VNSDQRGTVNFPSVRKQIYAEGYYGFINFASFASLFDSVMHVLHCFKFRFWMFCSEYVSFIHVAVTL
jgi:hypothetical protein